MQFNEQEIALILSALSNDTVGKWGDERSAGIKKLINKIKKEKENKCVCTDKPPYEECLEHSGY